MFPAPNKSGSRQPFRKHFSFRKHFRRLQEFVGGAHWTMRDIQRTVETHMREIGIESDTVAALLNHNTSGLRQTYDKSQKIEAKNIKLYSFGSKCSIKPLSEQKQEASSRFASLL